MTSQHRFGSTTSVGDLLHQIRKPKLGEKERIGLKGECTGSDDTSSLYSHSKNPDEILGTK
jgi:hypothetical protein